MCRGSRGCGVFNNRLKGSVNLVVIVGGVVVVSVVAAVVVVVVGGLQKKAVFICEK